MKLIRKFNLLSIILCYLFAGCIESYSPDSPFDLRNCNKTNPIGVESSPYFGWRVNDPDDNEIQTAYQVIVASSREKIESEEGDYWNSGKVNGHQQNYIYYEGRALQPAKRYFWKIKSWDKDDHASPFSKLAFFETGLFTPDDWKGAKWIGRNNSDSEDYSYFRKKVELPEKVIDKAVLFIATHHSYELYINGSYVRQGHFHHYPEYAYYHSIDIAQFLKSNSINIIALKTHWYSGGQGRATATSGLLVKAILEYADHTSTIVVTDSSWKQIRADAWIIGQTQRNGEGVGHVELIDSRNFIPNWNKLNYDDSKWERAIEIGSHPAKPWIGILQPDLTKLIEVVIAPKTIKKVQEDQFVVDLGKIYPGRPMIEFEGGKAGDTVRIRGGFVLDETGLVSWEINQRTNMDYFFIMNGEEAVFQPSVYLGMRYFQIDNSPNGLNKANTKYIFRHYELNPNRAYFRSSDSTLNRVWKLMVHSLLVGAQEGFVDTPTREKGPFLNDSWSQGVAAMVSMGDRIMNQKALEEFLDSQEQFWPDGRLNAVYPNADGARDIPDYTQIFMFWVWDYYMQTGNIRFLKDYYESFKNIVEYIDRYKDPKTGLIHNLEGGGGGYEYGIIDWPPQMRYGYDMDTQARTVINVYAFMNYSILTRIAEILNIIDDREMYTTKAKEIKNAINRWLINGNGLYVDGLYHDLKQSDHNSQHANMLPLVAGIVPVENVASVAALVKERKMNVGMVTVRWLIESVGQTDQGDHLLDLYTRADWDGWAKTVQSGGTVTWESWDAHKGNLSMSHPWGAVGLLGIQQYILGVKTLTPQHEMVQIKPLDFKQRLKKVEGKVPTDRGNIFVSWEREGNFFQLSVNIPNNIRAEMYIPAINSGKNSVRVNNKKIQAVQEGDYLFIGTLGSGEYIIEY